MAQIDPTQGIIEIQGIIYTLIESHTPEQNEERGLRNLASHMREFNQARQLWLQRPNGKTTYFAVQYNSGAYSSVSRMGRW